MNWHFDSQSRSLKAQALASNSSSPLLIRPYLFLYLFVPSGCSILRLIPMWFEGQSALGVIVAVRLRDLDVPVMLGIAAAAGSFASGWIGWLQMSLTLINVTPKSAVVKKNCRSFFFMI